MPAPRDPAAETANMIANLEKSTGKTIDQWVAIAKGSGLQKHGEMLKFLQTEHGLSYGYANLVVHKANSSAAATTDDRDSLIEAQYAGGKADLFEAWQYKRDRVNRFFKSLGYTNINVNQKTFGEDAYGIEQQSRNYNGQNRNMLTTNATARLMSEIVLGRIAGTAGTEKIMELLRRDPFAATNDSEDQAHGFSGISLIRRQMTNARLWSKARLDQQGSARCCVYR